MSLGKVFRHGCFEMYPLFSHVASLHTLRCSLCWNVDDFERFDRRRRGFLTLSKIQKETRSNQAKVETRFVSSEAACQDKANGHQAYDRYLPLFFYFIYIRFSLTNRQTTTLGAWKLSPKEIKLEDKIASGAYGEVWKGALHDRWIVAIKKLFPQSGSSSNVSSVSKRPSDSKKRNSLERTSASKLFKDQEIRFLIRTWCSSA